MQCNAVQCSAVQCSAVQCSAVQCSAMQCNAMQCNAMQCNAMQCNAMQCSLIVLQIGNSCGRYSHNTTILVVTMLIIVVRPIVSTHPPRSLSPPWFRVYQPNRSWKKTYDNGSCVFFRIFIYNQIVQNSKMCAMGERCPLRFPLSFSSHMFRKVLSLLRVSCHFTGDQQNMPGFSVWYSWVLCLCSALSV